MIGIALGALGEFAFGLHAVANETPVLSLISLALGADNVERIGSTRIWANVLTLGRIKETTVMEK